MKYAFELLQNDSPQHTPNNKQIAFREYKFLQIDRTPAAASRRTKHDQGRHLTPTSPLSTAAPGPSVLDSYNAFVVTSGRCENKRAHPVECKRRLASCAV